MKCRLFKNKKGFTLVELTVAMAISAIAMSMLVFCLMSINSFLKSKQLQTAYIDELIFFKTSLVSVFENYQTNSFVLNQQTIVSQNLIFTAESQDYVINYSENSLFNNGQKIEDFNYINSVGFSTQGNLVKCNVKYGEDLTYTIILNKRV
ncbi:MAG: prepilin-type N-terminal cleavage/methylation domain-containing protein [Clostridia bacterium]|nr:prepilin-type N-terminal cleavage/methylation domain-containing protein [Clostridia bacterium]